MRRLNIDMTSTGGALSLRRESLSPPYLSVRTNLSVRANLSVAPLSLSFCCCVIVFGWMERYLQYAVHCATRVID